MSRRQLNRTNLRSVIIMIILVLASAVAFQHLPLASADGPAAKVPAASLAPGDWPMYGYDQSRTNFNPAETAINKGTVGNLKPLWQAHVGSNGVAPSGAPSVANGRVYVASSVASGPNFFAFDATGGARAWATNVGHIEVSCFNVGIGATPAVSGNVVVAGGGDAAYYGLDATTGAQIWRNALNVGSSGFPWASRSSPATEFTSACPRAATTLRCAAKCARSILPKVLS